jgi:glutathione S-transferase
MTELLGLPYSPWTEKARWALDARGVPYEFRHYQPLLGEPALRAKLRRLRGRVSVPVLTDDAGAVVGDSADIARWADGRGEGPTFFPAEHADAIAEWVALSERALAAGRALALARVLEDDEALLELVPDPELRVQYADVIAWRNTLYARHRP